MKKPLIMYVDDDESMLYAIQTSLQDKGYEVLASTTADGALTLLKETTPDLIITDLRMSPMNGYDLFQQIRKNPRLEKTPVFFLTGINDSLALNFSQKLGVDGYILKPVDVDELDTMIRKRLALP